MTLEPQKAKKQIEKQAEEEKRERRVAPEYTLVWSEEAWQAVNGRSGTIIREVGEAAYARIHKAEAALCGALDIVTIVAMDPLSAFDKWWTPFRVGELWFVLKYHDKTIREYEIKPAMGPTPDGGGEPPVMTRRQTTPPPKRVVSKARAKKTNGAKSARPAAAKKQPKQTDTKQEFTILYRFVRRELNAVRVNLIHSSMQLQREFRPRLLRTLVQMRRIGRDVSNDIRGAVAPLVQMSREFASIVHSRSNSFTRTRDVLIEKAGPAASLQPRCVGQNTGLHVLIYTWIWDEPPPVDWTANLFGVLPIDWTGNLFGVLPEEERAFI